MPAVLHQGDRLEGPELTHPEAEDQPALLTGSALEGGRERRDKTTRAPQSSRKVRWESEVFNNGKGVSQQAVVFLCKTLAL